MARIGDHYRRRPLAFKKMQCSICVVLGMEGNIEAGLHQCEAKEFAFAWAVFDQEDGGVRHHYYRRDISRDCAGLEDEWLNDRIVSINNESYRER